MPSLADATGARRRRERRRLATGVGLLVAGSLLVGLGAAGAVRAGSLRTGATAGGLAVWVGLVVLAVRAPLDEDGGTLAAAGAAVGLGGLLGFWALAPVDVFSGPVLPAFVAGFGYLLGLTVVMASVLAAATGRAVGRRPALGSAAATTPVAWTRAPDRESGSQAADGGSTDDDLSFPLEDD